MCSHGWRSCRGAYHITLYCSALYCTVPCYILLRRAALHCTALHCTYCTALRCTYCTALHCTYCTALHCTALCCTVLCSIVQCCIMLCCTVLYCIVLHCTYCTVLCCIVFTRPPAYCFYEMHLTDLELFTSFWQYYFLYGNLILAPVSVCCLNDCYECLC